MSIVSSLAEVLRVPAFGRFLLAAICSGVSVWLFQTAIYWMILEQTGSSGSVGVLVAVIQIPTLLLVLPAGLLTDRAGPNRLMLISQAGPALATGATALASAGGAVPLELAIFVTLAVGAAYALWGVPSLVFVTRIVEPRLLGRAIGLMVVQYALGRVLGGLAGGWALQAGGPVTAFGIGAGLFAISALATLTLPSVRGLEHGRETLTWRGLTEALRWMRQAPATLVLTALAAVASFFSYAYIPLLPPLARDVVGVGAAGLGFLTAGGGFGMLASAVIVDALGSRVGRGRGVIGCMIAGALIMAVLGYATNLGLAMALLGAVAFLGSSRSSMAQLLLQSLIPGRLRGRVTALTELVGQALSTLGSLAAGWFADVWTAPTTLLVFGLAIVVCCGAIVLAYPRLLTLDVDADARTTIGGLAYREGRAAQGARDPV